MVKFGIVNDRDNELLRVRVFFPDDGITSHWLPVVVANSNGTKYFHLMGVNTHVACLMDERNENGVCLGAIYDESNAPSVGDGVTNVEFPDGSTVSFDGATSTLSVETGTTKIESGPTGLELSRGGESLKVLLTDILTQIQALTVTCAAPTNPSSPPINLAAFATIAGRLTNLFKA